ncbi:Hypothetical predicted protein [Lynx pardinus]|uniref:Uncharacterized protein n=1 Tax=Lynx pardinus TaxID=191816 RepID=A0A485P880_LYNPA|nr:Hypothetical predicted protein [Lynx pardinus]
MDADRARKTLGLVLGPSQSRTRVPPSLHRRDRCAGPGGLWNRVLEVMNPLPSASWALTALSAYQH